MTLAIAGVVTGAVAVAVRTVRGLLALLGTLVFGVAILVAFVPGAGVLVPAAALVDLLGSDYVVIAAVGLGAVGLAVAVVLARSLGGVEEATPPAVEDVRSAPRPGERFDRSLRGLTGATDASGSARERLRETAVRTVMRTADCPRAEAERRVDEGTWTDDRAAARLLAGEDARSIRPLRDALDGVRRLRRTVDAIAALDEGTRRPAVEPRASERRTAADEERDREGRGATPRRADGGERR